MPPKLEIVDPEEDYRPKDDQKPTLKRKPRSQNQVKVKDNDVSTGQIQESKRAKREIPTEVSGRPPQNSALLEDGRAMAPVSWDQVREKQNNKSILQFFSCSGTPIANKIGENSGFGDNNVGIKCSKGQDVKVNSKSKGEMEQEVINTSRTDSQASFSEAHKRSQPLSVTDP